MKRLLLITLLIGSWLLLSSIASFASSGSTYTIITGNELFSGGGTTSNSGTYGQVDAIGLIGGYVSGNTYTNGSGLWTLTTGSVTAGGDDTTPPNNVDDLTPSKNFSTEELIFIWTAPTDNVTELANMRYNVYRSTTRDFSVSENIAANLAATQVTVTFSAGASSNYFMVKAVDEVGNESASSDVGIIMALPVSPNPSGTASEYNLSLPYKSTYQTSRDFARDFSEDGSAFTIIQRHNYSGQTLVSYIRDSEFGWDDNNTFDLLPTENLSIFVTQGKVTFNIIGVHDSSIEFTISPNASGTASEYRLPVPLNGIYRSAYDFALDVSSAGDIFTIVQRKNYANQTLVSYIRDSEFGWDANNFFTILPGESIRIFVTQGKLSDWKPKVVNPE